MVLSLALVGLSGFFAMTWLFPVIARVLIRFSGGVVARQYQVAAKVVPIKRPVKCVILLPAHNEEKAIGKTLDSINRAIRFAKTIDLYIGIDVVLGADACTDATAQVANEKGAWVIAFSTPLGKWQVINILSKAHNYSDYVILADSGVLWPETFIVEVLSTFSGAEVMGVAPTYSNPRAGIIEEFLWKIERHFKNLESAAGGPISVHGATVAYRGREFRKALAVLENDQWLNDDVVVPLLMRAQNPLKRIVYKPGLAVEDQLSSSATAKNKGSEFPRRRRMALGNVEWIRNFLLEVWLGNWIAGLLAMRRVFRLFWAWWGLCLASACLLATYPTLQQLGLGIGLWMSFGVIALVGYRIGAVKRLIESAVVSLMVPVYLLTGQCRKEIVWQ